MASPLQFYRNLRALAAGLPGNATRILVGRVAQRVGAAVVFATPVDTTHARSNWVPGAGAPSREIRPLRSEFDTIREIQEEVDLLKEGDPFYISNGGDKVPYLGALNNGWSAQAPAGFIQLAILAGIGSLEGAKVIEPTLRGAVGRSRAGPAGRFLAARGTRF